MLGFQTDWDFECLVFDWTQIGVVLRLGFIAKQRSGFGFCYQASDPTLQGYHFTLSFKLLQLTSEQTISPVFNQIQKSKQKVSPFSNIDMNHSWDENPSHVRP